jgi:hypothetical protein
MQDAFQGQREAYSKHFALNAKSTITTAVCFEVQRGDKGMSVQDILEVLDREIANLAEARRVLTSINGSSVRPAQGTGRRTVNAAARRKMAAAQKARWAKYRSNQVRTKPNRVVSLSARRKMAAAQKARWAKVRASKKAA